MVDEKTVDWSQVITDENGEPIPLINSEYEINFPVPEALKQLIGEAEQEAADWKDLDFMETREEIGIHARNFCAMGTITEEQRDIICGRYGV